MKNIVLIGLPGCGKTTTASVLAGKFCRNVIDIDKEIETDRGLTINEIFARGEDFRSLETIAAKKAAKNSGAIISTGGGIILKKENMDALKENGIVVFLNRDIEDIVKTIDIKDRPLMSQPERLYELAKERLHLYKEYCDFEIVNRGINDSVFKIGEIIKQETPKKQFAVIGSPISHSLSPLIHSTVFNALGYDFEYVHQEVPKGSVGDWIKRVKEEGIAGFNVTMPNKSDIIPYLDQVCGEARAISSVNTVVEREGKLLGYSTDGDGFCLSLQSPYTLLDSRVLILGTGGASSTLALKAAMEGAKKITVLGRRLDKARELCNLVQREYGGAGELSIEAAEFNNINLNKYSAETDILVNATPLGMVGNKENFEDFGFLDRLPKESLVYDLIYKPVSTQLIKEAKARDLKIQNGLNMLIYQALVADRHFLQMDFDIKAVMKILRRTL